MNNTGLGMYQILAPASASGYFWQSNQIQLQQNFWPFLCLVCHHLTVLMVWSSTIQEIKLKSANITWLQSVHFILSCSCTFKLILLFDLDNKKSTMKCEFSNFLPNLARPQSDIRTQIRPIWLQCDFENWNLVNP